MRKRSKNTSREARSKARSLRKNMSASEDLLWEGIRKKRTGFSFRRQVQIGAYVLDFYCAEAALCVEVDGEQHLRRQELDAARDAFLRSRGIETLRIRSLDLFEETRIVRLRWIERIQRLCEERSGRLATDLRKRRTRLSESDGSSTP